MPVTLLLPGALLPREVVDALREPLGRSALAVLLQRAELLGDAEAVAPAHLAWLGEHLFQQPPPLPTGPYALAALTDGAPAPDRFVWQAEPIHLGFARDHLVVTPIAAPLPPAEAEALLATANALTAEAGAELARAGDRWFLRTSHRWDLGAPPLTAAIGRPLQDVMPGGPDAARWNRLLTEIQMAWHADPVNEAREARGEAPVNSVWLHGGGAWAALPRARFTAVLADAPEWRGAAAAAGLPAASGAAVAHEGALAIADTLLAPRLLQDWSAWLAAAEALAPRLAALATGTLDIVLTGDTILRRLRAGPRDRLKFWRSHSLEQTFAA